MEAAMEHKNNNNNKVVAADSPEPEASAVIEEEEEETVVLTPTFSATPDLVVPEAIRESEVDEVDSGTSSAVLSVELKTFSDSDVTDEVISVLDETLDVAAEDQTLPVEEKEEIEEPLLLAVETKAEDHETLSTVSLSELDSVVPNSEQNNCKMCQKKFTSPRVLACLHVFCEPCILDILIVDDAVLGKSSITCPLCKQATRLNTSQGPGVAALHNDYILTNIIDISKVDPGMLACTSCKSKETAISRCNDCANFLCASCDSAHQYMRCFENHKVVPLEQMRHSLSEERVHRPLFCRLHAAENLKYFCFNCQVPICNECLLGEHKGPEHNYEIISDAEKRMRREVEGLMCEARTKFEYCEKTTSNLDTSLQELQNQHDAAQSVIEETYQSFKELLEKCHREALGELERLHSERELKIMDLFHNVEKSADRIETACSFTTKVLEQANAPEFLSLKKMISSQFLNLIHTIPKADVSYSLQFVPKRDKFEAALAEGAFGKFHTETSPPSPKESTPPPTLPGMPPALKSQTVSSATASSPISLPTSMQSSFDGDISVIGGGAFMAPQNPLLTPESPLPPNMQVPPPQTSFPPPQASFPGNLSSIAEYNLHRLANIVETSTAIAAVPDPIAAPPPALNGTGPQFTIADLISGDQNAFNALAKIGLGGSEFGSAPRSSSSNFPILPDFPIPPPSITSLVNPSGGAPSVLSNLSDSDLSSFQSQIGVPGRTKATPMQIRCKFGSLGPSKGQFNAPHGFCLGLDEEIIVADTNNHRIQIFEKNGTFKFQFGVPGKDEGQLWYPRKVAVMRTNSRFVVCDRGNERSRMQIFTKNGHFIKKIAIRYIDIVAGLAVTNAGRIVAVDSVSPTVFIISEEGELVHWFDCSEYMREPSDIAINGSDFYVCDFKGHCVAVFTESGQFLYRIGNEKVTCFPNGIDISDAGDILIGDSHGNRFHVACYSRDGVLQSEFECPHVKVSRCCGLKITSEGYVVTLAKNNHHVLVLNTLYIQ